MEDTNIDEKVTQQSKPAENTNLPIGEDLLARQQNDENDNDDAVVYHSLMNAAPETQEVGNTQVSDEHREVQLEFEVSIEDEPEPKSELKPVKETVATTNFDLDTGEQGQHETNHSETQQGQSTGLKDQLGQGVASTNSYIDLPIISTQQAGENIFKSSTINQSAVDAQMEKVIDDIVELGGCQQFGQTLEQQGGVIDKEKEVRDIQRQIIGDGNLNIKIHELVDVHSELNKKEQHSQIEAEKHNDIRGDLPEISDLSSLQGVNLEQTKEDKERPSQMEEQQQPTEEPQEKELQVKGQQQQEEESQEIKQKGNEQREEDPKKGQETDQQQQQQQQLLQQQQPRSNLLKTQKGINEGQQSSENPLPVDETQPPSVSNEEEKSKSTIEDKTPKEINDTANTYINSNVANSTNREVRDHGDVEMVISLEKESSEQQIEKPGRRQRRGSAKKIASAADQSVEQNKIEEEIEPEVRTERRSSRRIKISSKAKDEEVEEPTKPTRRKKEDDESKVSKDLTEDKDVSLEVEPESELTEAKDDDADLSKGLEKPAKGVRGARATRKSTPAELPKVKLERKPMKRSLEKDDSHNKSLQPMLKTPSRSVGLSARSITAPSSRTKIDHNKSRVSSEFDESKKYRCLHCAYSTDRLNNIVYHKKSLCAYVQKHFDESVEKWKQELQSPKSNNKRSSR